ncbi:MAG TPA: hypothetical protein VFA20_08525 [Myxococcaceae bacterium]|nr:hypothetical protein [Myxococcaceae bacterium]
MRASIVAGAAAAVLLAGCPPIGNVITQRVNNYRNGAYLLEDALNPGNVHTGSFGRLYERKVDGQQLANPLLVKGVTVGGASKTLFFVATAKNCLYAFDLNDHGADLPLSPAPADHCHTSGKAIWYSDLGNTSDAAICGETFPPRVGITSTPAIDDVNGFMYVTSYHNDVRKHFMYKINIATGATVASREMTGSASGKTFNPICHRQRPGLLLQGGVVYAGFGTFTCDQWCPADEPYRGWVLGFNATDLTPAGAYTTAPTGGGAGIWQAGSGLIGDGSAVYFLTGNETEPALGDSFVKIVPGGPSGLMEAGHFTPSNHHRLTCGDTDLGAGAATYIPDGGKILGGGKEGKLYLVNSTMPGTAEQEWQAFFNTWHDNPANPHCVLQPACLGTPDNIFAKLPANGCFVPHDNYQDSEQWSPNIHSAPIYWKSSSSPDWGFTYLMPEKEHLKLYRYNLTTQQMETTPFKTTTERNPDGMPGAALSLSASLNTNGIVWANIPNGDGQWVSVPGHLVAYDAESLNELYRDDDPVAFAKFNPPVAAAGHVIRATFADRVIVYGLLPAGAGAKQLRPVQVRKPPFPLPDPGPLACYSIPEKLEAYGAEGAWKVRAEEAPAADQVGKVRSFVIQEVLEGGCGKAESVKTVDVPISIYWSPETCAHPIRDPILGYWTQLGGEKGRLGYPVTDEIWRPDGTREQMFERGSLVWSAEKGVSVREQK